MVVERIFIALLIASVSLTSRAHADDGVSYSKQVVPILRTYCMGCHSRVEPQGDLSLQSADDIEKGSEHGAVLNAADPGSGKLAMVLSSTGDDHMPPADQPQPSADELAILTRWIHEGGRFDSRAVTLPKLPEVKVRTATVRDPVLAMQWSPDGQRLAAGRNRRVDVRGPDGQEIVWSVEIPDGKVQDVRWSADGERILVATGTPGLSGRALEFEVGTAARAAEHAVDGNADGIRRMPAAVREFGGHGDILYAAAWSPDGTIVATAGYDRRIILHEAASGTVLREMTGHNGAIFDLDFSPDGALLATASADATIKVWNVATGERFDTLGQPQSEQYAVSFSPDGGFLFGAGADSRIRKWQLVSKTTAQINPLLISRFAHEGAITAMELSADGQRLVTVAESGSVKAWDAATVEELVAVRTPETTVASAVVINGAGRAALISLSSGGLMPFDIPDGTASMNMDEALVPVVAEPADSPAPPTEFAESEPNEEVTTTQYITLPAKITGVIYSGNESGSDVDAFRFDAQRGRTVLVEVRAERDKSPLDSAVEVLTADGMPVLQTQLQAVRDSYFTFRGKDADTSDDFRLFNWQEMELNEYLYADGEVVKLWLYPRGPDSGFKVYPGFGPRETQFNTTPTSHPLQGPAFIVEPHGPQAQLKDSGLPVFPIYAENDDDPMRQWGHDSRLMFVPPADGTYVVRIRDARGFHSAGHTYQLILRSPQPDFSVAKGGDDISIHGGTGRELSFTATRLDGFTGPIEIVAENLPPGFSLSDPVVIQDEQRQAFAILIAAPDAVQPADDAVAAIKFTARASIAGREIVHDAGGLKSLKVVDKPKVKTIIQSTDQHAAGSGEHAAELTVYAGETTRAFLKVERLDHTGLVEFGKEDSGRNMPHGVFVDNIGLNGLMLLDGQTEREFFITVAKWVPESSRPFYLKSSIDGITSLPVMLHVRHRDSTTPVAAR